MAYWSFWQKRRPQGTSDFRAAAREKSRSEIKGFVTRMRYENYLKQGLSPEDAASRVGVNVRPGLRPDQILRVIQQTITRRRI